MRKNWKKLTALVLTVVCTMVLTMATAFAAQSTPEYSPITDAEMEELLQQSIAVAEVLADSDEATLESYTTVEDQFTRRAAQAWLANIDDLGALVELGDAEYEKEHEFITCTIPAQFEKNRATIRCYWNVDTRFPTDFTVTVEETASALIGSAAMNTIVGIGVVFAMLVFLIFVISMFKYVNKIGQKKAAPAPAKKAAPAPAPVAAPVVEEEDDLEIQAVIAAAIAMYEEEMANASGDAYVARPLNKKRNWKRA